MRPSMAVRPAPFKAMRHRALLQSVLEEHLNQPASFRGLLLEFGVAYAESVNMTARHIQKVWRETNEASPVPNIYAFDSFRGLPRAWLKFRQGESFIPAHLPQVQDQLPPTEYNVK